MSEEEKNQLNTDDFTSTGDEILENDQTNSSATEAPDEIETLRLEADKYKKEFLYLRAEFDNYKKNMIKERSELVKYGSERLVLEILNVLDIFERALETKVTPDNLDSFVQGVNLTATELASALQKVGVEEINCESQAFDPAQHEALSSEETSEVEPGFISQVFKKGYTMHKKVIRPSQVVVAKEPSQ